MAVKRIQYFLFAFFVVRLAGCSSPSAENDKLPPDAVYVDTITGQTVIAQAANTVPAIHPGTGKRTLMPALYCTECGKWYAVPPVDQINRVADAALCSEHDIPLVLDGPWPGKHADSRAESPGGT